MDSMAIWSEFAKTGKVEDYLVYRQSLQNKTDGDVGENYENEHRGTFSQRTEYS